MNDKEDNFEQALEDLGKSMAHFVKKAVEKSEELLNDSGLQDLFQGFDFPDAPNSGTTAPPPQQNQAQTAQRQPAVDVFDEDNEVLIYVEMPGLDEGTLEVENRDGVIHIKARTGQDAFEKEIDLPHRLSAVPNYFYKNGILKIQIKKGEPAPPER